MKDNLLLQHHKENINGQADDFVFKNSKGNQINMTASPNLTGFSVKKQKSALTKYLIQTETLLQNIKASLSMDSAIALRLAL